MEQQTIQSVTALGQSFWPAFSLALILLLLAGFLCLEAGYIQQKNNMNAAIKSVVNLCVVFCVFFIIGHSLMMGSDRWNGFTGEVSFFLNNKTTAELSYFLLYASLCCVSIAIISGGIAERCKFLPFLLIAVSVALLIYPVFGHWVWGNGWLARLGFHDFAGASVVHLLAAGVALSGIRILGPRKSRLNQQGELIHVYTTNAPLSALGIFFIIIGWFGIVLAMPSMSNDIPTIFVITMLAASFAGLASLLSTWAYLGIANVKYLFRGILGGLVAISAGADVFTPQSAMIVGTLAGVIVPMASAVMVRFRLDDVVGVVASHGAAAIIGILAVPLFMKSDVMQLINRDLQQPLNTYTFLLTQCLGVIACVVWSYVVGLLMWKLTQAVTIFHLRPDETKIGLNYTEHMTTEPLHDLNTAVDLVRKEQILEAKMHFDRLENSDLEGLSAALRELLNRDHRDV